MSPIAIAMVIAIEGRTKIKTTNNAIATETPRIARRESTGGASPKGSFIYSNP
jgi:hypothetical protein